MDLQTLAEGLLGWTLGLQEGAISSFIENTSKDQLFNDPIHY